MQSLIPPPPNKKTALLLSGGGARAAYQVGVLKAIQSILYRGHRNPFHIICGVSAGAINATVLASHASHFRIGIRRLEDVWSNFSCQQVFRTDLSGLLLQLSRYMAAMVRQPSNTSIPLAMLNSRPLRDLLKQKIPFGSIARSISRGDLYAACITASSFTTGESVSYFQGHPEIQEWNRHRRLGRRAKLTVNHLMASSAIPLIFPPAQINQRYYGDGSVHFLSPLSPAVHLGADKVLIISVDPIGQVHEKFNSDIPPSMAEVAGHVFDSVLVDSLESDLERLTRINQTLDVVDPVKAAAAGLSLKKVTPLVIAPDRELFFGCGDYFSQLPIILRFFMRAFGISSKEGQAVLSFLLFEQAYTKTLIEKGYQDGMKHKPQILDFFEQ